MNEITNLKIVYFNEERSESLKKPERIFKIDKNDQKVVYCIESFSICEQNQCFHFETTGKAKVQNQENINC